MGGSELTEIIIPSMAFFLAFFLVFTLLEFLLVLFLNTFVYKHWIFVTDVVVRIKVRHGGLAKWGSIFLMSALVTWLIWQMEFIEILREAGIEVRLYAILILLTLALIYLMAARHLAKLTFLKQIHKYLYVYLSVLIYLFMIVLVHHQYLAYQQLINATIVVPIEENVKIVMENRRRKELLSEFRDQIAENQCTRKDFTVELSQGNAKHFMYVTTDPDLSLGEVQIDPSEPKNYTAGRACTYDNETFLLTDYGQWFWVIDA